jgi:hypothetical protein
MNWKHVLVAAGLAWGLTGCAAASLSAAGSRVTPLASAPGPECKNLGTVIGAGGGAIGGAYIRNDQLVEYALNDAMNKAAARGATHLQTVAPSLGGYEGTTTTATVMAIAYRCPGAPGEPEVLVPVEKSALTDCPAQPGETLRARAIRCRALAREREQAQASPTP